MQDIQAAIACHFAEKAFAVLTSLQKVVQRFWIVAAPPGDLVLYNSSRGVTVSGDYSSGP